MKKEDQWQLTNLELSRRLKELGEPQDSFWSWFLDPNFPKPYIVPTKELRGVFDKYKVSAYTVAELGRRLMGFEKEYYDQVPTWDPWHKKWYFDAGYEYESDITKWIDVILEANARAKMLIYLLENNLIKRGGEEDGRSSSFCITNIINRTNCNGSRRI